MSYVQGRFVHDADSHVMETLDWLDPFIEGEGSETIGKIYENAPEFIKNQIETALARKGNIDAEAQSSEKLIDGPKGWVAYGAFDPEERAHALDKIGFQSQLVFGTYSLAIFSRVKDDEMLYLAARAQNKAMAKFCEGDSRLVGVAYIPLNNTQRALEELDKSVNEGAGAVQVYTGQAGNRSPGHIDLDPFWAELERRGIPFVVHIGPGTMMQPEVLQNNGRERAADLHGGGENLRFPDYIMLSYAPQVFLTTMVYDGVFERFPNLKGGVIECGAGWVPEFLRELDTAYKSFIKTDQYLQDMKLSPSEQIRRAVKFTPFPKEDLKHMIEDAGPELFMFSSDYPHPEGSTDPIGYFESTIKDMDETVKERFYRKNYEEMLPAVFATG